VAAARRHGTAPRHGATAWRHTHAAWRHGTPGAGRRHATSPRLSRGLPASRRAPMTRHRTRRRVVTGRLIDHPASPCPPWCPPGLVRHSGGTPPETTSDTTRRTRAGLRARQRLPLVGVFIVTSQPPARLAAWIAAPAVLATVLTLNLLFLIGRLVAGRPRIPGRTMGPRSGTPLRGSSTTATRRCCDGWSSPPATPEPRLDERVDILIVGR